MIRVQLRGRAVSAVTVDLDHELLFSPHGVDEVAVQVDVDLGDRDALGFAEEDEVDFAVAAGISELRQVDAEGVVQCRGPGDASADCRAASAPTRTLAFWFRTSEPNRQTSRSRGTHSRMRPIRVTEQDAFAATSRQMTRDSAQA